MKHNCQYCGSTKTKRNYWRWIINKDEELNKKGKKMLLNYLMYILYKPPVAP